MRSRQIHNHLRANVIGYVALFFSLSLGTAWALENNSVRSKHIVNGQVKGKDTKKRQVQARVDARCTPGRSIRAIAQNGSVTCETVGGGGAPTGPAGGDLTGAYPNPQIAANSVTGAEVAESTLAAVPSALTAFQGGLGRYGDTGSCDPETTTFIPCSVVSVTLTVPARLLVMGTVRAFAESDAEQAHGICRIGTTSGPVAASEVRMIVKDHDEVGGGDDELASVVAVTDPFPAGTHAVGIDCNQVPAGAIQYEPARVVAVALSAG